MKVLFIVPYATEGPSNRFRVEQYLPELERNGIKYSIRPFCNTSFYRLLFKRGQYIKKFFYISLFALSRLVDVCRGAFYDIIFIHREAFPTKDFLFELLFLLLGKKIIYDFDDAVFLKKPWKIRFLASRASFVIAGNSFLRDYAARYNRQVTIIPTCIDTDKYTPVRNMKNNGRIIIGWIGTPSTAEYLSSLNSVFVAISRKYKQVEFRIIGSKISANPGIPIVNRDWRLDAEVGDLQEFDIGIMPMPLNEWTKGKCAFKIIQYMAVGIPAIASPVGMNAQVMENGKTGFLVSSESEWFEKLSYLVESESARREMGANGRRLAEEKYSLKVNAPKFIDVLEKVTSKR